MVDTHLLNKYNIVNLDTFLDDNYLSSKQITNCITKIPQNVILELNNGTLTIKTGTKYYIPDGFESDGTTPKFRTVTLSSDSTLTSTYSNVPRFLIRSGGLLPTDFVITPISVCYSGATAPTGLSDNIAWWYDTTNNVIKLTFDSGVTWSTGTGLSFPLAIVHTAGLNTQIEAIDQVFNGFGYIGSTVFALPGVEGLIPNGRNDDGTLKSIKTSITDVRILDFPVANLSNATLFNGTGVLTVVTNPVYDSDSNFNYNSTTKWMGFPAARYSTNSETKIISLDTNTPLHCVDYSDFNVVEDRLSSVESNYLTTDTTQTVTGFKTISFSSGDNLYFKTTNLPTNGTTPSSLANATLRCLANDGSTYGLFSAGAATNGENYAQIVGRATVNNTTVSSTITAYVNKNDGTTYASAPTPTDTTSTISKQIATVGWCNTNLSRTDLSNSPYTTNRILEIPQDIKLTLSNGTLTLKAGSKCYCPNGFESDGVTPHFDIYTVPSDYTFTSTYPTNTRFFMRNESDSFHVPPISVIFSGSTPPTNFGTTGFWYDTSANIFKRTGDGGTTWVNHSEYSLPLAIVQTDGTQISSIDQIFNGFGYIGSTMFMLPGIKVEYTIDRNPDGTYIKQMFTSTSVMTNTISGNYYAYFDVGFDVAASTNQIGYFGAYTNCMYTSLNPIVPSTGNVIWYNPMTGQAKLVNSDGTIGNAIIGGFRPCRCHVTAGKIDWWTNNNSIVNTVNSYSRPELAGMGMPSSNYIELTLGATGSKYTAPANGWFHATGTTSAALNQLNFYNGILSASTTAPNAYGSRLIIPVNKGDFVTFTYSSISPTLHFVYAEGEV